MIGETTGSVTFEMGTVRVTLDAFTQVATLSLQAAGGVNRVGPELARDLAAAVAWIRGRPEVRGILLASAHRDFCVGADLDLLFPERDPARLLALVRDLHAVLRDLEKGGLPVVAVIAGSALGGGCEIALACHRRLAVDHPRVQIGLPEVNLGVIPGLGGTQRLPRLLGVQPALENLLQGKVFRARDALAAGLVDEVHPDPDAMARAAVSWIHANPGYRQPWDRPGFRYPAPEPDSLEGRQVFLAAAALLHARTAGVFPAATRAIQVVQEGARVTFDRSLEIEARAFARLATSDQAKDMMRTLWFHKNACEKAEDLPRVADHGFGRVGVLGAGMMGAGLAWVYALRGFQVVLKDIRQEALDGAVRAFEDQLARRGRHMAPEERVATRGRLSVTLRDEDLAGCDLVVEAVVEDLALKHRLIRAIEPFLPDHAVFASNTSALPISDLAKASRNPDRFVGLHYFSPVDRMPLVEIIPGRETSEETLGRCLAFARATRKTPIVVNDGFGFYTTRVFAAYVLEGAQLVAEGHDPVLVEWAARTAGMAVPPLQVLDEVSLGLGLHVMDQSRAYVGDRLDLAGTRLLARLVREEGRPGRAGGAGFYEYEAGRRVRLWPGLRPLVDRVPDRTGVDVLQRRILLVQAAEVARALSEGIVTRYRDAEVGAVFGLGFHPGSGGPLAWMDRQGLAAVVEELSGLADRVGPRYAPAPILRRMAAEGARFYPAG